MLLHLCIFTSYVLCLDLFWCVFLLWLGRGLVQAGIMDINECKRSSASARAKQYADSHFVHSSMDFVVKFVAANVSSCVLKTMLYTVKSFYSITLFN